MKLKYLHLFSIASSGLLIPIFCLLYLINQLSCNHSLLVACQSDAPPKDDRFKLILGKALKSDKFRLQYELNLLFDNQTATLRSLIVDEAYSKRLKCGRKAIMTNHHGIRLPEDNEDDEDKAIANSMYFWNTNDRYHESHWLRPFVCSASRSSLKDSSSLGNILFNLIPRELSHYFVYLNGSDHGQVSLQGIGAFLLNIFENNNDKIDETISYSGEQLQINWIVQPISDYYQVEISAVIEKSWLQPKLETIEQQFFEDLIISITKRNNNSNVEAAADSKNPIELVAFFKILSFSHHFDESIVRLPSGYLCSSSILPLADPTDSLLSSINAKLTSTSTVRTKYTYEVTTITTSSGTQISNKTSRVLSHTNHHYYHSGDDYMIQPVDSLIEPKSESKTFELLHDQLDNIISIVSSRSKSRSIFRSSNKKKKKKSDSNELNVWDFNMMKWHRVNLETGRCLETGRSFTSSIAMGNSRNYKANIIRTSNPKLSGCSFEGVELSLSEKLSLRLNEDGLRLLKFTFQDRSNLMQLIEINDLNGDRLDNRTKKQFVYERAITNEKFCLIDSESGFLQFNSNNNIRLITKYLLDMNEGGANNIVIRPQSSSLLFFDGTQSQLMLQIDFNLIHVEPFELWSSPRQSMLDLSGCKRGYKESAKIRIEYSLTEDSKHVKDILNPKQQIRQSIATNLYHSFDISLLRLPAIEVDIVDAMVQVELQLLERANLKGESTLMDTIRNVVDSTKNNEEVGRFFNEQLNRATRSVLLDNVNMCADYCQFYQCEIFTYCSLLKECFIFTDSTKLSMNKSITAADDTVVLFGSYQSLALSCDSYKVPIERVDGTINNWKKSWSLEEILKALTDSINLNLTTDDTNSVLQQVDDPIQVNSTSTYQSKNGIGYGAYISFVAPMKFGPKYYRTIRLSPSYVEYNYENVHSLSGHSTHLNPFDQTDYSSDMRPKQKQQQSGDELEFEQIPFEMANNFKILKNGYKFIDSQSIQIHAENHQLIVRESNNQSGGAPMNQLDDSLNLRFLSLENQRLDDCLRLCLNDLSCSYISYCIKTTTRQSSTCSLTSLNRSAIDSLITLGDQASASSAALIETPLRVHKDPRCSLMERTYSDQFNLLDRRMIHSHIDRTLSETIKFMKSDNIDDCASECFLNRVSGLVANSDISTNCLSFDYCQPIGQIGEQRDNGASSICILFKDHLVGSSTSSRVKGDHLNKSPEHGSAAIEERGSLMELLERDQFNVSADSYCAHYGRNFLADFHSINQKRLPNSMRTITLRNFIPKTEQTREGRSSKSGIDSHGTGVDGDDNDDEDNEEAVDFDYTDEQIDSGGDETSEDISLVRCASLCEEDPNCGAFEYCLAKYNEAPHNLYLSCSLSNESSFNLVPIDGGTISAASSVANSDSRVTIQQLPRSRMCSVYIYERLSLILGHKKKNLASLSGEIEAELAQTIKSAWWNLFRLDVFILIAFFLFGFIVKDTNNSQFAFRRLSLFGPNQAISDRDPIVKDSDANQISLEPLKSTF